MKLKPRRKLNKKAVKRSFWAALGRVIGVGLSAGAGTLMYQTIGAGKGIAIGLASFMAVASFLLVWLVEYERETEE